MDKKRYTLKEDNLLREVWYSSPKNYITTLFPNRSWVALKTRASRLKVKRNKSIHQLGKNYG